MPLPSPPCVLIPQHSTRPLCVRPQLYPPPERTSTHGSLSTWATWRGVLTASTRPCPVPTLPNASNPQHEISPPHTAQLVTGVAVTAVQLARPGRTYGMYTGSTSWPLVLVCPD